MQATSDRLASPTDLSEDSGQESPASVPFIQSADGVPCFAQRIADENCPVDLHAREELVLRLARWAITGILEHVELRVGRIGH